MLITTYTELKDFIAKAKQAKVIVLDTETNGLHPYQGNRIIGMSLYLPEFEVSCYIPFRHGAGDNLLLDRIQELHSVMSDPTKEYYGWNVKFDQHFLSVDGFPIIDNGAVYQDVMIALHLLDENRYDVVDTRGLNYKLKDNAAMYLGVEAKDAEDELKDYMHDNGISGKGNMWKMPASMVHRYAEMDVILTWQLYQFFLPYLAKWNQVELFKELAEFNSGILARMENEGIAVNRELINQHIAELKSRSASSKAGLQAIFGDTFNPNSPKQVAEALGVPNAKKTTLEQTKTENAKAVLSYKQSSKADGTFYKPYLAYSAFDGRIHPTFNLTRTNSGRLSSSDPNLQQVPKYPTYKVKEVMIPPDGYTLLQADYSQQELRLACYFSGQENMTDLFIRDIDTHTYTASILFNKPMSQIDGKGFERQIGKTANFGFLYGMGLMKAAAYIASSLKQDFLVDRAFFDDNLKRLPKIDEKEITWEQFIKLLGAYARVVDDIDQHPGILSIRQTTEILDNWRKTYEKFLIKAREISQVASSFRDENGLLDEKGYKYYRLEDNRVRHFIVGQRPFTAWNFLIQGTGAIIMRKALMRLHKEFTYKQKEVLPVLTVHDSVVLMIKTETLDKHVPVIKTLMESFDYYPKMKIDIQIGSNWGQLEKY